MTHDAYECVFAPLQAGLRETLWRCSGRRHDAAEGELCLLSGFTAEPIVSNLTRCTWERKCSLIAAGSPWWDALGVCIHVLFRISISLLSRAYVGISFIIICLGEMFCGFLGDNKLPCFCFQANSLILLSYPVVFIWESLEFWEFLYTGGAVTHLIFIEQWGKKSQFDCEFEVKRLLIFGSNAQAQS